jgi:hypothetical protein
VTESHSNFKPFQLRLDPVGDIERADALLASRAKGSKPGERRLLTERREAMAALASMLRPGNEDRAAES